MRRAFKDDLFQREFGKNLPALEDRSFFVITDDGEEIGSITAWWRPDWRGKEWGMIHWVAIHPDYQGRGLAKPAMTVAMKRLKGAPAPETPPTSESPADTGE